MKVVVTGGMGFLGTNVCEMYKEQGEEVWAIDNLTKYELERNWYDADKVREYNLNHAKDTGTIFLKGNIINMGDIDQTIKDADYLINCAAQPAMTLAIEDPRHDFYNNVYGLMNLLELCRKYDIPFAHCSSIHVFGNSLNGGLVDDGTRFIHPDGSVSEDQRLLDGEITPLHASKRSGEIYVQSYIDTYGLKAIVLRLTGIYGEHQFGGEEHGWVANFAIRTVMDKPITVFGTDKQVRDILYVKDASRVFDAFYNKQKSGVYNCGGGESCSISICECLRMLWEVTHNKQQVTMGDKRKGDLWWFVTDNTRITDALGWCPKVIPNEGIMYLVDWIKSNQGLFV